MSTEPAKRKSHAYTKGPWVEFSDQNRTVAILPAMRAGEVCAFATPYPSRANARLIAASPCLLDALTNLVNASDGLVPRDAVAQARDAITKATGAEGR